MNSKPSVSFICINLMSGVVTYSDECYVWSCDIFWWILCVELWYLLSRHNCSFINCSFIISLQSNCYDLVQVFAGQGNRLDGKKKNVESQPDTNAVNEIKRWEVLFSYSTVKLHNYAFSVNVLLMLAVHPSILSLLGPLPWPVWRTLRS
jgi:hypothetical protein